MMMAQKVFSTSSSPTPTSLIKKELMNKKIQPIFIRSHVTSFINFYSWFLIVPFKITWEQSSGKFVVTTSKIRRIVCGIANILGIISTIPYLIGVFYYLYYAWTQPTNTLTSVTNLISFIAPFDFLRIYWKKTELLLGLLNWHLNLDIDIVHQVPLYETGLICIVPCILVLLYNPMAEIVDLLIRTPYSEQPVLNATLINLDTSSDLFRWSYYTFYTFSQYGHLYYLTSTGFMLAIILTIKESISQITKPKSLIIYNAKTALLQGVKMETEIRNLMNMSNSIIGNRVILEYFMMLSFYASILEFFSSDYSRSQSYRVHVLIYLMFSGGFWMCACEVHCSVRDYIKEWANSYRSTYLLDSPETLKNYPQCLLAVQTEADLNPVAVSCRCFNVTYGFLGSMMGLIITYSTIVYQMKFDKQCKN